MGKSLAEKVCRALAVGGTHAPADIEAAIASGHMQAWFDGGTLVITCVSEQPLVKICRVFLVAGDLEAAWRLHDEQIIPWAKSIGCTRMLGEGRLGWVKSARAHGYNKTWFCAAKEI